MLSMILLPPSEVEPNEPLPNQEWLVVDLTQIAGNC